MLGLYRQEEPFLSIETGRITAAQFFDNIRKLSGRDLTDVDIERAVVDFLVSLPVERLQAMRRLRAAGYRVYMISNTNAVMYDGWISEAFRQEGLRVGDYFDGIITSFAEGVCKPDPAIFERLLGRYSLDPAESLLLDDSEANCEAARRQGMQALRIIGDTTLCSVAEQLTAQ